MAAILNFRNFFKNACISKTVLDRAISMQGNSAEHLLSPKWMTVSSKSLISDAKKEHIYQKYQAYDAGSIFNLGFS